MQVKFPLLEKEITCDPGTKVSQACEMADVPLNLVCGGRGTCDKCRVDVNISGEVQNVRGCQFEVQDGMEIFATKDTAFNKILETKFEDPIAFHPLIENFVLDYKDLETPLGGYDYSVISEQLGAVQLEQPSYEVLKQLNEVFPLEDYKKLNIIVYENSIIDLIPADDRVSVYGIAFDIGTTSVVGFLYDLHTGELVGQASSLNGQIKYGADVISRIQYAQSAQEHQENLAHALYETLNNIISTIAKEHDIDQNLIYEAVYCGNSTIQHLFMKFNPRRLGIYPFTGTVSKEVVVRANEVEININPHGFHKFMPLLGAFVGADTTACIVALPRDDKFRMMIDLGTNGEIALGTLDNMYVTSTACGPALEGAGLSMGMRGTEGAIEKVAYKDGKFEVGVIGDVPAIGYCGSGIVDIVSSLLKSGLLSDKGNFIRDEELANHPLKDRIQEDEEGRRKFVLLTDEENQSAGEISIALSDIRAVQLAKAAIITGCELLIEEYGIEPTELDEIMLAGAFGNYIDVKNAQHIGMIPNIEGVPVKSLGNGAGLGVQRYLLSEEERELAEAIRKNTTHVELASTATFTTTYLGNMQFAD